MAKARPPTWTFAFAGLMLLLFGYYFVQSQRAKPAPALQSISEVEKLNQPSERLMRLRGELNSSLSLYAIGSVVAQSGLHGTPAALEFSLLPESHLEALATVLKGFDVQVRVTAPVGIEQGDMSREWTYVGQESARIASKLGTDVDLIHAEGRLERGLTGPNLKVVVSEPASDH